MPSSLIMDLIVKNPLDFSGKDDDRMQCKESIPEGFPLHNSLILLNNLDNRRNVPINMILEPLAKVGHSVIPANPGSGPGQAPESRIA